MPREESRESAREARDSRESRSQRREEDSPNQGASQSSGQDAQVAENAGLAEGELRALRSDSGVNLLAGHEANVLAWEATQQGQEWLQSEDERQEAIQKEVEQYEQSAKEVEESQAKYTEALDRGREVATKRAKEAKSR